jgi:ribosome-associated protein
MRDLKELTLVIAEMIDAKKGSDVVILDLRGKSNLTDFLVIATGLNDRHALSLAHHVEKELSEKDIVLHHKEGHRTGDWVVLDYYDVIVHIFNEDKRKYYNLERLWKDAHRIEPTFVSV